MGHFLLIHNSSTDLVMSVPAAIIAPFPFVTSGKIVTYAPQTKCLILTVFLTYSIDS